jgi:hypothetical protein
VAHVHLYPVEGMGRVICGLRDMWMKGGVAQTLMSLVGDIWQKWTSFPMLCTWISPSGVTGYMDLIIFLYFFPKPLPIFVLCGCWEDERPHTDFLVEKHRKSKICQGNFKIKKFLTNPLHFILLRTSNNFSNKAWKTKFS